MECGFGVWAQISWKGGGSRTLAKTADHPDCSICAKGRVNFAGAARGAARESDVSRPTGAQRGRPSQVRKRRQQLSQSPTSPHAARHVVRPPQKAE
jgi:hypothetical protein